MRAVVQRVSAASVRVEGRTIGRIGRGLLVLVGIGSADLEQDGAWLAGKLAKLRIFADSSGQMNLSVSDVGGDVLVVSQFTLHASTAKGTRPSFNAAAPPALARTLYESFVTQMTAAVGRPIQTGEFGAMMQVELVNDGPVTLILDSKMRE
jgi:D-tyrosyl-tRNA(Tyr) deacylase